MTAPDQKTDRIVELDALRGFAVIGIVLMNVYVFALPAQAYYNPIAWGGEGPMDRLLWVFGFVFIEDKFRTLFAMLFGVGCMILLEKTGSRAWRAHYARMVVLLAIGVIHATLFASNDVLRAYALAGLALPFLAQLSARALIAVAVGLVAVHIGGGINLFGSTVFDWLAGRTNSDVVFVAERNFGSDQASVQAMLERGREGFGERVFRRVAEIPLQIKVVAGSIPLNLAAMALGIALWRDGMLAGEWRTFRLQRLAAICAMIALPCLFWLAWWVGDYGFPGALVGPTSLILSAPFDLALGVAYAASAMALFASRGPATERLAAVGRLSLTNYLMTSVILAAIFASWGLGLFGYVSRSEAFALSFVPIAAMLVWSPIWAGKLGQGPFERIWRAVARLLS
ncbi:MAG: DUF418 domain-containing protein [Pseudomonadota bacterium]